MPKYKIIIKLEFYFLYINDFSRFLGNIEYYLKFLLSIIEQIKGLPGLWQEHSMARANLNKSVWLVTNTNVASKYILDDLCGTLIGLVHSPLVQNFTENLVTTLVSSISLPLFSANNIYNGIFY